MLSRAFTILGIGAILALYSNSAAISAAIKQPSATIMIKSDPSLKVSVISDELEFPTAMAFLGPDDILVAEKNTGLVKRIVNGNVLKEPLLDVNVANQIERGLLGMAVSKNITTDKTYVFLFYTESPDEDSSDYCSKVNDCDYGYPLGHRLYRYQIENDERMVNPQLLLDLPTNPGGDHLGGAITVGPDNNIYLATGDGDSCEYNSCEEDINDSTINSQTANIPEGDPPKGRGGIIRVTQDGDIVVGENGKRSILGDEHPLDMYYAYGIRNSFGIDFDPITGHLWDTENGPGFGDEINLVEPGFNSGWMKTQGIWSIDNPSLLSPNPMEDEYFGSGESTEDIKDELVDFDKKGKYSDPEFTWNSPVGATALEFLNSDALGKQYENDLFVGDIRYGNLYHFDLTRNRIHLDVEDKVANSPKELGDIIFAQGFGGITDLEVGPDGCLYILTAHGTIYKIQRNT